MDAIVYDKVGKEAEKIRNALYGIYPKETITNVAIASFADGADGIPVEKIVTNIEPIQDLHGYDHPWYAGGGKNKLVFTETPVSQYYSAIKDSDGNIIGAKIVKSGSEAELATVLIMTNTLFPAGDYILSASSLPTGVTAGIRGAITANINATNLETTFTLSTAGEIRCIVNLPGSTEVDFILYPMIRLASESDATFVPYSNICPISGLDEVEVKRTGKNLFNKNTVTLDYWLSTTTGLPESASGFAISDFIPVFKNVPVFIPKSSSSRRWFYDRNKTPKTYLENPENQVYTPTDDGFIRITFNNSGSNAIDFNTYQVEFGNSATTYETFVGTTLSVTFPTEAGTVYGGTLDLETGELVVDRGFVTFDGSGDESIGIYPTRNGFSLNNLTNMSIASFVPGKANLAPVTTRSAADHAIRFTREAEKNGMAIWLYAQDDLNITTVDDFRSFLTNSPLQLCYELATPITYTLTPKQLETVRGINHISANGNTTIDVDYRADLGKYIDSHIITAVANTLNA